MLKTFKYRILPNNSQAILINRHIGACRFIYNLALETKIVAYAGAKANLSMFDLQNQLPSLKKECNWLNDFNAQSLQASIRDLEIAFKFFFKGNCNYPKFKKKKDTGSFRAIQRVYIKNNKLFLPKFLDGIKIVLSRKIEGNIRQATITRTPTGKYFASILCETGETIKPKGIVSEDATIGVDLGIKTFIVTSNEKEYNNPKFLRKSESKLKYLQRKYSKHKGKRTKQKLALIHEKVANQRKDFLHKVSTELIRDNQSIAVETLQVSNMLKNHKLAKSISDAGWGMFVAMLEYKANWYGKNILKIGTFEPSSKTCSCCGKINKELTLKDRKWTCIGCNSLLDRDTNAAINIKNFALRNILSGIDRKNQNELPTLVGVLTSEMR